MALEVGASDHLSIDGRRLVLPSGMTVTEAGSEGDVTLVNGGSQTYVVPSGGSEDAPALQAVLPDLGLRVGTYKTATGIAVASQSIIQGRGPAVCQSGSSTVQGALTEIEVNSQTVDGLYVTALGCVCDKFGIKNTSVSAPTAGAGIHLNGAHGARLRDVSVRGAYDGIKIDNSGQIIIDCPLIFDPIRYGVYVTGTDNGEGRLENAYINSGPTNTTPAAAVRWEGGGGFKIHGLKINRNTGAFVKGLDFTNLDAVTSEVNVSDSVIDAYTGVGVNLDGTTFTLSNCLFSDVQVRNSLNGTNGYKVRHIDALAIQGGMVEGGTNTLALFDIDFVNQLTIDGVAVRAVPAAIPIVQLGSSVRNATVKLANIGPPGVSGANTWTAGTIAWLLSIGQFQGYQYGGQSSFEFAWKAPTVTSTTVSGANALNSATINMADVTNLAASGTVYIAGVAVTYTGKTGGVGGSLTGCGAHAAYVGGEQAAAYVTLWDISSLGPLKIELEFFVNTSSGSPGQVLLAQKRMYVNVASVMTPTVLATDTATSTDVDIQWRVSGHHIFIEAKINSASTLTSLTLAHSAAKITGVPSEVHAYN